MGNYLNGLALERASVALVNTLGATSGAMVMCLAAIPFLSSSEADKFTIPRCLVTLLRYINYSSDHFTLYLESLQHSRGSDGLSVSFW